MNKAREGKPSEPLKKNSFDKTNIVRTFRNSKKNINKGPYFSLEISKNDHQNIILIVKNVFLLQYEITFVCKKKSVFASK